MNKKKGQLQALIGLLTWPVLLGVGIFLFIIFGGLMWFLVTNIFLLAGIGLIIFTLSTGKVMQWQLWAIAAALIFLPMFFDTLQSFSIGALLR